MCGYSTNDDEMSLSLFLLSSMLIEFQWHVRSVFTTQIEDSLWYVWVISYIIVRQTQSESVDLNTDLSTNITKEYVRPYEHNTFENINKNQSVLYLNWIFLKMCMFRDAHICQWSLIFLCILYVFVKFLSSIHQCSIHFVLWNSIEKIEYTMM